MSSFSDHPQDNFSAVPGMPENGLPDGDSFGETDSQSTRLHMAPLVLAIGFATTVLVLFLNFLLTAFADFDLMLITMARIIPVGALLIGMAAGCGYGLGARFFQFFPSRQFILAILAIQLVMFFASRYAEYLLFALTVPDPPGFFEVYKEHIEGFFWKGDGNQDPVPLGKLGYFLEFATATLFAVGSLVSLGILHGVPYCRRCKVFMRNAVTVNIPASAKRRKVKKNDLAGKEQLDKENAEAFGDAMARVAETVEFLLKNEGRCSGNEMGVMLNSMTEKTPVVSQKEVPQYWFVVKSTLARCPRCDGFHLEMQLQATNQQDKTTPMVPCAVHVVYRDGNFLKLDGFGAADEIEAETGDEL